MRPGFKWALALTAVGSGLSLLLPSSDQEATAPALSSTAASSAFAEFNGAALPASLAPQRLTKTNKDPFASRKEAPPPPPAPVQSASTQPLPESPRAPVFSYRYLGQFIEPGGKRSVFLVKDDREVAVVQGSQLEDGFVVDSIEDAVLTVVHRASQTRVDVPLPNTTSSKQ